MTEETPVPVPKPVTDADYQQNFLWLVRQGAGKCKHCDFVHDGFHRYSSHLQKEHPEEWEKTVAFTGMTWP